MKIFVIQFLGLPLLQFEWGLIDEEPPKHLGGGSSSNHDLGFRIGGDPFEPINPSLYPDPD